MVEDVVAVRVVIQILNENLPFIHVLECPMSSRVAQGVDHGILALMDFVKLWHHCRKGLNISMFSSVT